MARRRRPNRTERRKAQAREANRLARERGAAAAGDVPIQNRIARHQHQLDRLAAAGAIGPAQCRAGHNLSRDHMAGGDDTRLRQALYAPGPRPPRKHRSAAPDGPGRIAARARFDAALAAVDRPYRDLLIHTAVCDQPPDVWTPGVGVKNGHGHPVEMLRAGLEQLAAHYARQRGVISEPAPRSTTSAAAASV